MSAFADTVAAGSKYLGRRQISSSTDPAWPPGSHTERPLCSRQGSGGYMKISAWRAQLEPALKRTPVSITDVIEIQEELQRAFQLIPDGPAPLSAFNNLYLTITRKVLREYQT